MACDVNCVVNNITTVILILSVPLYTTVLVVLIKRRNNLNSSFFDICISVGFADIFFMCFKGFRQGYAAVYRAIPATQSIIESTIFQTGCAMMAWSFYYPQIFGILVLTINRLTSVCWPLRYKTLWTKRSVVITTTLQWLTIFMFPLPMLHPYCHAALADNVTFATTFKNSEVFYYFWGANTVIEGCLMPIILLVHFVIVVELIRHSNEVGPVNVTEQEGLRLEVRYTIIGLMLGAIYVFSAVNNIVVWYVGDYLSSMHTLVAVTSQVLFAMMNPILLLVFSSKLKENFWNFVSCGNLYSSE